MNEFDKQRIENAIWTIKQYEYEIKALAGRNDLHDFEIEDAFYTLDKIKEKIING